VGVESIGQKVAASTPRTVMAVDPTPAALGDVSIDAAIESCTGVRRDEFGSRMDLGQLKPAAARGPL